MSIILNPSAPLEPTPVEMMVSICRVLHGLRQQFLNVEKAMSAEGITASQIEELAAEQQRIAQQIVNFVLYERLK